MQVVFRNKNLLQSEAKENKLKRQNPLTELAKKIKQKHPMLYAEVGVKNIKQILKAVFGNMMSDKSGD